MMVGHIDAEDTIYNVGLAGTYTQRWKDFLLLLYTPRRQAMMAGWLWSWGGEIFTYV